MVACLSSHEQGLLNLCDVHPVYLLVHVLDDPLKNLLVYLLNALVVRLDRDPVAVPAALLLELPVRLAHLLLELHPLVALLPVVRPRLDRLRIRIDEEGQVRLDQTTIRTLTPVKVESLK